MGTDAAELVAKCSLTTEEALEVNREMKATNCVQELPTIPENAEVGPYDMIIWQHGYLYHSHEHYLS